MKNSPVLLPIWQSQHSGQGTPVKGQTGQLRHSPAVIDSRTFSIRWTSGEDLALKSYLPQNKVDCALFPLYQGRAARGRRRMLRKPYYVLCMKVLRTLAALAVLAWPTFAQNLDSRLAEAARSQDPAEVTRLLKEGANPNARDKNGRTPLMESASEGYTPVVRALLENGAEVNAKDHVGWTALFWAAFSNRTETLRALVAHGADVNARDGEGRTALSWAASSGYTEVVLALIEKGGHVNAKDSYGWTALMSAVDLGQLDTVKALLQHQADARVKANDGTTAMRLAEKYKYDEIVNLLRSSLRAADHRGSSEAEVDTPESAGKPALGTGKSSDPRKNVPAHTVSNPPESANPPSPSEGLNQKLLQAAEAGDTAEVLSLIRDGAGVNARGRSYGNTALMEAAARGHTDTVRALMDKGGEVDTADNAGRTALMEAAFEGYTETVRVLLSKNADVNAHDHEGWTPLFWAVFSRRTDTARFLLEKGAAVNAQNKYQDTALLHASYGGDTDTVAVLLEFHAELNHKDDMGRTALIEAARQGHTDTARMLLEHGADEKVAAKDGSTALSLAEKMHKADIVALLKNPPRVPEPSQPVVKNPPSQTPLAPSNSENPQPSLTPGTSDPVAVAAQALQRKKQSKAFYRIGLSMRLIEEYWPQQGRVAERAAASILGDLTNVSAPQDLIELSQQAVAKLSASPEDRRKTIPALSSELHNRLNQYCLALPDEQFFYSAGTFTYDVSRFGQDLTKSQTFNESNEATRVGLLPLATSIASQCKYFVDCKDAAASFFAEVTDTLSRTPLGVAEGKSLVQVADEIGVALGSDEP
jgi:ankyrin repeat protein